MKEIIEGYLEELGYKDFSITGWEYLDSGDIAVKLGRGGDGFTVTYTESHPSYQQVTTAALLETATRLLQAKEEAIDGIYERIRSI